MAFFWNSKYNIKRAMKKVSIIFGLILTFGLVTIVKGSVSGTIKPKKNSFTYKTYFGTCPTRSTGALTLNVVNNFEENKSLLDLKKQIISNQLDKKYFLSQYKISFNPLSNVLSLSFECPKPLMKVQIYNNEAMESSSAILVDNGELFDPTFEELLRQEKIITTELPSLALPYGEIDKDLQKKITTLFKNLPESFSQKVSEVIINEQKELTIILSLSGNPSSSFLGSVEWDEKIEKLQKIIKYMEKTSKIPTIINLTNPKKVVVKFLE